MTTQNNKFRGGIWIGWLWANSWPNGILEVTKDALILRDEMLKREFQFSKGEVIKIETKKFFPVIGYGIRISHNNENYNKRLYFWYVGFHFNKLINSLKEFGWLSNTFIRN